MHFWILRSGVATFLIAASCTGTGRSPMQVFGQEPLGLASPLERSADKATSAVFDSQGDDLSRWLNQRGREIWGEPPEACDDLTFARRLYLDLVGRVPSVSEIRDYESLSGDRRRNLVHQLVFAEGERAEDYGRLSTTQLARHWVKVLLPSQAAALGGDQAFEGWLRDQFESRVSYDQMARSLVEADGNDGAVRYFALSGQSPQGIARNVSRSLLGVRLECAECHDHPFTEWKQEDFWGLAAFFGSSSTPNAGSLAGNATSKIVFEGAEYVAKLPWSDEKIEKSRERARRDLADWLCSPDNPQFASNAANRFWRYLVGRGLYADVENLDQAGAGERLLLDELGAKFAERGFAIEPLLAAICKSDWYQAISQDVPINESTFYRPLKTISPDQVFNSMEQSLLLPVSRVDANAPRWSGERAALVARLGEAEGSSPDEYVSGIPQALAIMNGRITAEATSLDRSRLLRAVVESPFFGSADRIEVMYLALLSRRPTNAESEAVSALVAEQSNRELRNKALADVLWTLLNSPEFVLCR